jgi:ribose 5-phosphate isomerase B
MKIAIGCDHAGYLYKEKIKQFLKEKGHQFNDFGTHSEVPVDYPLFIRPVAVAVRKGEFDRGIVLGGSGNGEAMVANRINGIRCALCWNIESALLARKHNDSNILSLGARMISSEQALEIVDIWLKTPFDGGRHFPRIRQIDEKNNLTGRHGTESKYRQPGEKKKSIVSEDGPKRPKSETYDLLIAFRYIKYIEGEKSIEFQVDPGLKNSSIMHIPSPERWDEDFPEWARNRRDEILFRIKEKTGHMDLEFKEY